MGVQEFAIARCLVEVNYLLVMTVLLFAQVLSLWNCVPYCGQNLRNGRSLGHWEEAGFLCHYRGVRPGCARAVHPANDVLLYHQEESYRLHQRDPSSLAHCSGHLLQVSPSLWMCLSTFGSYERELLEVMFVTLFCLGLKNSGQKCFS